MPNPKCYFCDNEGVDKKRVAIDVEANHDIDEMGQEIWYANPIYSEEWLCQDHLNELEEEGYIGKH